MDAPRSNAPETRPNLALAEPIVTEVPVGARFAVKARVSCPDAGELSGARIDLLFGGAVIATQRLGASHDGINETEAFTVTAPDYIGTFTWTLRFPRQESGGIVYSESALAASVSTRPLKSSLAVWSVPSPIIVGQRFRVMVGARSSGACALAGARIAIRDADGKIIGEDTLGATPWPETDALYWTEIELVAPTHDGVVCWSAAFAATDIALPHTGASTAFSFATVKRPEHCLTVKVTADGAPVESAQIALGPYRAVTNGAGVADIEAPAGEYDLAVWHADYEAASKRVPLAHNETVAVALTRLPEMLTVWG